MTESSAPKPPVREEEGRAECFVCPNCGFGVACSEDGTCASWFESLTDRLTAAEAKLAEAERERAMLAEQVQDLEAVVCRCDLNHRLKNEAEIRATAAEAKLAEAMKVVEQARFVQTSYANHFEKCGYTGLKDALASLAAAKGEACKHWYANFQCGEPQSARVHQQGSKMLEEHQYRG